MTTATPPAGAQDRRWSHAVLTAALAIVIVLVAAVAGFLGTSAYQSISGARQPGVHPAGTIEAMSAAWLGAYFAAFQVTAVLLTLAAAGVLRRRLGYQVLGLQAPRGGVLTLVLAVVALLAIATAATSIVYHVDREALASDLRPFAELARSRGWWVLLLAAGVGAPLAEEMLFRGFLFSGLRASPLGFAGAALVSAAFWTSLHMTYSAYGLTLLVVIGLYFAWLRERSGSILPSMVAHAVYNGLIVVALSLTPEQALS